MPKHGLLRYLMGAVCQKTTPPAAVVKLEPGANDIEGEEEIRFRTDTEEGFPCSKNIFSLSFEGYVRLSTNSSLTSDPRLLSSSRIFSEPLPDPIKSNVRSRALSHSTTKGIRTPLKSPIRSKSTSANHQKIPKNSEDENDDVFLDQGSSVFRFPESNDKGSVDDGYSRIKRNPSIPT